MDQHTPQQDTQEMHNTSQQKENSAQSTSKSLKQRYITGAIMIALVAIIFLVHNPLVIWLTLGVCFILSFRESFGLFGVKPKLWLYAGAIAAWILAFFNSSPILSGLFVALIVASILAYKRSISAKTILPFLYPTLPFLAIYSLYAKMGGFGLSCLIWLILITTATDTGAYFGGKAFGRTPFSPTSPNKTLEGAGIGITLGVIAGSIMGIGPSGGFIPALLISICVALGCVFGDLFESYLKREAGIKDSGNILPGHGGMLDRFDGILFGAMVMYYLLGFLPMWQQL
ncbi:phosphatidate cytidylyltransferase [Helicobacter pametensis]|uniref:phosphatidate cytidylyltransferase n=1 Tax=Helicobacter pametensis TaxID=95149 RepID=UPI0004801818|nr:phosphatidate cytidylyltransferase [Helicobacter pametensis]